MARLLLPDTSTRPAPRVELVAGKIPGSMTLRPASRAVHHRRALLARVRGQAQAQDFPAASGPRRGGCAPRRGAPGGAGRTHKPRMRGVRQHAKTKGCCSSAPAPHDGGGPEDEFNEKFYSMQAPHGRGHSLPDRRPVCAHRAGTHSRQARCATCAYRKTPIRATGSNGLHPPAGSFCLAGLNYGKGRRRVGAVRRPAAGRTRGRGKEYQNEGP